MTAPVDPTVLRRKIAAHRRAPVARPDPAPQAVRALGRALRHAATPFEGLGLLPGDPALGPAGDLEQALAFLPEQGLLAVVEGAGGGRGLLALAPGLVDALVEVQTTGRIEPTEMPPRPVTRIDEALARDFIDLALAALGRESTGIAGRDWPARLSYASLLRDRKQITLLLPEGGYRVLQCEVGFDSVARRAQFTLVLPIESHGREDAPDAPPPADAAWIAARARMVEGLELPLEAVLMRLRRPLAEVQGWMVGDLLRFDPADLQSVTLEAPGARALALGRLGQKGGRRAICLSGRGGEVQGQPMLSDAARAHPAAAALPPTMMPQGQVPGEI
jgi:flagellar motor switch protein FliM